MKKILSRILAMAIAIVLFAAPVTTQAATWQSIIDNSSGTYTEKTFIYNPADPLVINAGDTAGLPNNVNSGGFFARAGQGFTCSVIFTDLGENNLLLYNQLSGQLISVQYTGLGNFGYIHVTIPQSGYYIPVVQPVNGYNLTVEKYTVYVY